MMEKKTTERTEEQAVQLDLATPGIGIEVPIKPEDVVPLNCQTAFESFTEAEQKEILQLSEKIDVRKMDKVMAYGSEALNNTFNQCGEFLKNEKGSQADQMVIARVVELSKKASDSYDDFNLVLKEPNFIQKVLLKLLSSSKNSRSQKIQNCAVSNYKLLMEFKKSCDSWLEMLKNAMGDIYDSAMSDIETVCLLEKYIIAGKLAQDRIEKELSLIQTKYNDTGMQKDAQEYEELKEGYDIFQLTMSNLERSRCMYQLSLGQLKLIKRSNRNVQISIHTQMNNVMVVIGQQMRNAVLDAKNKEVLEGKKAIARLGDELIKDISKTVCLTAEETERLLYEGFCNVEASKEAITTVLNGCVEIQKIATEMLPKMKANTEEINQIAKKLEPHIKPVTTNQPTLTIQDSSFSNEKGGLKF